MITGVCRVHARHANAGARDVPGAVHFRRLDFRYIAIDGPIGAGKSALAERLAARLDASHVREDQELHRRHGLPYEYGEFLAALQRRT